MFDSTREYIKNIDILAEHLKNEDSKIKFLKTLIGDDLPSSSLEEQARNSRNIIDAALSTNSRRFTYHGSIISLYGYLENFLENIVREFIFNLNQLNIPFNELPKDISDAHLDASIDLLKRIQRDRSSSKEMKKSTIRSVVSNMNSCIQENEFYQLNEKAYSIHTANFRYDSIHNLFCKIGIHSLPKKALRRNQALRDAISRRFAIDSELDQKTLVSLLTSELDDLAQRRNEIAHGNFDGELESVNLVIERSFLLKSFGIAANEIITNFYYGIIFSSPTKTELGLPEKVFARKKVLGFRGVMDKNQEPTKMISIGDIVFSFNENSAEQLRHGIILSIVCNGEKVDFINVPCENDFAIGVNFEFSSHEKKRHIFTLSQKK
jgi:hypothetical protein